MAKRKANLKDVKFEQAIDQLETIIDRIETGEVGLEESLGQYERGAELIAHCRAILSRAETKIQTLTAEAGKLRSSSEPAQADEDTDED